MTYLLSQVDRDNYKWFSNDVSCASLMTLDLREGKLRGLNPFRIDFSYPITALAGENGSGKSTVLAMAACSYHNSSKGYRPCGRDKSYYTVGDFFYQSRSDITPEGLKIWNQFRHNNWRRLDPGPGWQCREKKKGGRWTNYDQRPSRNVIYSGINRVVPHYERSAHCSYRRQFRPAGFELAAEQRICEIASRIIGKQYTSFCLHQHSKYRLPVVECGADEYSGFNMGAGECAVFEILTAAFEAGRGALLVVDEIELGLHEKAQRRFIDELKNLCLETHSQTICSTHSPVILEALPPSARFYIECGLSNTTVTPGISPAFATGKLAGGPSDELDIFVEDDVAQAFTTEALRHEHRARTKILPIGSSEAVLRQLAARFREGRGNCVAFLDGDKRAENGAVKGKIKNFLERQYGNRTEDEVDAWIDARVQYLPGDTWPESWALTKALEQEDLNSLCLAWGANEGTVRTALMQGQLAGKHKEFYQLSLEVYHSLERVRSDVFRFIGEREEVEFDGVRAAVDDMLATL